MKTIDWKLRHGCKKISAGCKNCFVHRSDKRYGRDENKIYKTSDFDKIIKKDKNGDYKVKKGTFVWTCFSSDFFLEEADQWREEAWEMIRKRNDLFFFMITKRIDRFNKCIPCDWNDGYDNVHIACTCENQEMLDYRMPIYKECKIKHKSIICSPLLENIDLERYLDDSIIQVVVGGECGINARVCDYEWILNIRNQCIRKNVSFKFRQTGANFIMNGKRYFILKKYQGLQAKKANIDYNRKK